MKILTSTPLKYNQYQTKNNKKQSQSFGLNPRTITKVAGEAVTDGMAYGFGWLASTRPVQSLVNYLKDTNYQRHISAFVGVVLSSYYMFDTAKSKKIEKEQKMPLIVNQGTVSVLSTLGAYSLDGWLDKVLEKPVDTINIANISNDKYRDVMIEYQANKGDYGSIEKAAKVIRTNVKTNKQKIAQQILRVIDQPEELAKLKEVLAKDKPAQEILEKMNNSSNPKEMLTSYFERTDVLPELLKEKFQLKNKDIKSLKKMVEKGTADEEVKAFVEGLGDFAMEKKNKLSKISKLFLSKMQNSKTMKEMYAKTGFSTTMDILAADDKILSKRMKGLRFAKSIMVFAMIYRFVAPVIATPIANSCSDRVENYKKTGKFLKTA